jgi:hypothetical protein
VFGDLIFGECLPKGDFGDGFQETQGISLIMGVYVYFLRQAIPEGKEYVPGVLVSLEVLPAVE